MLLIGNRATAVLYKKLGISGNLISLSSEAVKHKVETHSLVARQPLPVNSIDVVSFAIGSVELILYLTV